MHRIVLKSGREKSLKHRHPWVFSGAVAKLRGEPETGETIGIYSSDGEFLAVAAFSPNSQIVARVWDWEQREIDTAFFRQHVERAVSQRDHLLSTRGGFPHPPPSPGGRGNTLLPPGEGMGMRDAFADSVRLVHAESDGLPGVVIDRYGGIVVLQLSSAGAIRWRDAIADAIEAVVQPATIFERSDSDVLALEGIAPRVGLLRGQPPPARVRVDEAGIGFEVDVAHGHKTGFYLDQRDNRLRLRGLAEKREVLDCFAYTGGFTVNALAGGAAKVTAIDSSGPALELLTRNVALNRLPQAECIEGDVFQLLRKLRDQARSFDLVVLDPPKFAPTAAHAEKAARAYKDINLLAFKLLRPGGLLFTFSCSGGVSRELFQKIVAGAALDANVDAYIVEQLSAGADHPVALNFPEGEYLKGFICRVAGGT